MGFTKKQLAQFSFFVQKVNGVLHTELEEQFRHFGVPSIATDIAHNGSSSSLRAIKHTVFKTVATKLLLSTKKSV